MTTISGFILAAGEGRRLRPASLLRPKALMPFCGVPMLELVASQLARLPLAGMAVNAWYLAGQVEKMAAALRQQQGWDLRVAHESVLLDTGGGLRDGARLLPKAEHILVHNADIVLDFDLEQLLAFHLKSGAAVTALLVPKRGPCTVELAPGTSRIAAFRKPHGEARYTFSGVHILRRDVLDLLPAKGPCSIIKAYEAAMALGLPVLGLSVEDAYWSDLGAPADYIRAHGEIADCGLLNHPRLRLAQAEQARRRAALERTAGVRCTGAIGVGEGLVIPPGTHLHNVVLWDDTRIATAHLYADSILTGNPVFPPPVNERRQPDGRVFAALDVEPATCTVVDLGKQGSGRRYARLQTPQHQSWIWCAYNPERRENAAFAAVADFLHRLGVRIPQVLVHLGDVGEVVSADLGSQSLTEITDPELSATALRDVIAQVARLHVLGERAVRLEELPLQTGFTKGLYDWERDYFREHILGNFLGASELWAPAAAEYCTLRNRLLAEPQVPIHRDLQSANIMLMHGRAYLIDFQGMRLGAAAYDLGSLLFDPYKSHPESLREQLWDFYTGEVRRLGGTPPENDLLYGAAVQRLLQALGAYGKLSHTDKLPWYRQFILPALALLEQAATAGRFTHLAALARDTAVRAAAVFAGTAPK